MSDAALADAPAPRPAPERPRDLIRWLIANEIGSIEAHLSVWGDAALPSMVRKKKGFEAMSRLLDHLEVEEAKAKLDRERNASSRRR